MPLHPIDAEILQWVQRAAEEKLIPDFHVHKGIWRPDFLVESSSEHGGIRNERFMLCEINARFPFELLPTSVYAHKALRGICADHMGYIPAADPDTIVDEVFTLFDPRTPIHVLIGGIDTLSVELFIHLAEQRTGIKPRVTRLTDLRLVKDNQSRTGFSLYCLKNPRPCPTVQSVESFCDGNILEKIEQVALQCTQTELRSLPRDILRHIACHSVNDLRSIFLVHDKRLLGIILQELQDLVHKHQVLTLEQVDMLERGIAPTLIPSSPELEQLISHNRDDSIEIKDDFIVKPAGKGDSEGITRGRDMSVDEWNSVVMSMQKPRENPHDTQYIIQRLIHQPVFDLPLNEKQEICRTHLVGTYHAVNGRFAGLGVWRSGSGRLQTSGSGDVWLASITTPLLN
ncbi:hypothetical protein BDV25DRAFT_142964 [Aspergillus avenaceus]|uniref:Uncharacterized protein n=1 Tax=Aspergillus avenaceus TaxID=36643 RepID=A0A5N6TLI1_ASPAV|nr:hypothetical protein BDV25DRAFT_142964 [Aspergillus avenaceus]